MLVEVEAMDHPQRWLDALARMSPDERAIARALSASIDSWWAWSDALRGCAPDVAAIARAVAEVFVRVPGQACWQHGTYFEHCRTALGCYWVPVYRIPAPEVVAIPPYETGVAVRTEMIARVCYDVNRALQRAFGETRVSPPWDSAPNWHHDAALAGVKRALNGASPRQLHELWCELYQDDSWLHEPVRDPNGRLVTYHELPCEHQIKEIVFTAVVAALSTQFPRR